MNNKKRISIFDHVYALELSLRATKLLEEALAMAGLCLGMRITSSSTKEHSKFIEKLTAEHKKCKLRCQQIEKQVNELLGSHCVEGI